MGKLIVAGIIVAVAVGVAWVAINYKPPPPTVITMNVTKTWIDPEPNRTYYLVKGVEKLSDGTKRDRVIELQETYYTKNTNIDIEFGNIEAKHVYTFACTGYENLQSYTYYRCVVK